jgi:hypothetical protein
MHPFPGCITMFLALINSRNLDPLFSLPSFSDKLRAHTSAIFVTYDCVNWVTLPSTLSAYAHLILLPIDSLMGLARSCSSALYALSLSGRHTQFLLRHFYGSCVYLGAHNFLWKNFCLTCILKVVLLMKSASSMRSVFNWDHIEIPLLISHHRFGISSNCLFILSRTGFVSDL